MHCSTPVSQIQIARLLDWCYRHTFSNRWFTHFSCILIGFSSQIIGLLSKVKDIIEKEIGSFSFHFLTWESACNPHCLSRKTRKWILMLFFQSNFKRRCHCSASTTWSYTYISEILVNNILIMNYIVSILLINLSVRRH